MVRNGVLPTLGGLVVGALLTLLLAPALSGLLFGVQPHDVTSFALSLASVSVAALLANLVPASRATRINPIVALNVA